jgi:hypothetical protein
VRHAGFESAVCEVWWTAAGPRARLAAEPENAVGLPACAVASRRRARFGFGGLGMIWADHGGGSRGTGAAGWPLGDGRRSYRRNLLP